MSRCRILCYHGSPGTIQDFALLADQMKGSQIEPVPRGPVPTEGSSSGVATFHCGYSYGSLLALRDALAHPASRGIILIAPFFGPAKHLPVGVIKFLKVVPLPLLLLSLIKGRVVRGFLEKTSAPASVPDAYQRLSEQFGESHALYNAILEKHDNWIDPQRLCQELSQRKIPLLVVYGSQDRVSGAKEVLTLLQESGSNPTFAPIPEGGHALLWTHTGQLAAMISNFCTQFA